MQFSGRYKEQCAQSGLVTSCYDDAEYRCPDCKFMEKITELFQVQPLKKGRAPFGKKYHDVERKMPGDQKHDGGKTERHDHGIRKPVIPSEIKKKAEYGKEVSEKAGKDCGLHKMPVLLHTEKVVCSADNKAACGKGDAAKHIDTYPDTPWIRIGKVCRRTESVYESVYHYRN